MELWPNATPIEQDSTVLSSNQSMPVANESGASTQLWRTPASILNHELWVPLVRTQLTELSYSTLKSLRILSGIPSLVRSSHNAGWLRESNAARRSTIAAKVGWLKSCLRCAMLHKVASRNCRRPFIWLCWAKALEQSPWWHYIGFIAVSFQKETENSLISAILSGHCFVVCYGFLSPSWSLKYLLLWPRWKM